MGALLGVAWRNIVQAPRRSLFLGSAIGLVTMLLVVLMSLSEGIAEGVLESGTVLMTGDVNVGGFYKASPSRVAPFMSEREKMRGIITESSDEIDYVVDRQRGFAVAVSPKSSQFVVLNGVDVSQESRLLETLTFAPESSYEEGGRDEVLAEPERLNQPNTAIVSVSQAERLGLDVGDVFTLSAPMPDGRRNTADVTIAAVIEDLGIMTQVFMFVSRQTIENLYQISDDTTGSFMIYLKDRDKSDEVRAQLQKVLEDKGYTIRDPEPVPYWIKLDAVSAEDWTGLQLDLTTWEDEMSFIDWIVTGIDTIAFVLVSLLVVIISVGIMNAMWMAVRKRTQEVGALRAIGMSRSQVLLLFMLEALLLGLVAATIGALLGAGLSLGINAAELTLPGDAVRSILLTDTLRMTVNIADCVFAVLALSFVTGLSALWPAARAARLRPVDAMRHV